MQAQPRILFPTSGPPWQEPGFVSTLDLAEQMATGVLLLRLRPAATDEESLYAELRGVRAQLRNYRVPMKIEVESGPAAEAIVRCAEENEVDTIVIPRHHHNGDNPLLEPDLAEKVRHHSHRRTLVAEDETLTEAADNGEAAVRT